MKSMEEPAWVKDDDIWQKAKSAADKAKTAPDDYYAVVTTIYKNMGGRIGTKKESAVPDIPFKKTKDHAGSGETGTNAPKQEYPDDIWQMLIDNPKMSAGTFCNLLKSKGYQLVKDSGDSQVKKKNEGSEADSSSSQAPSTRAGIGSVNPLKKKKESVNFKCRAVRLQEKSMKDDGVGPTVFSAILIEEGLGNLKDTYYYTKDALKSAVSIFEGKKIYADHPTKSGEEDQPERSVRDILGYFENVEYREDDGGRGCLVGDVHMVDEQPYSWARGLMRIACNEYSKKFPDKEFVGLSINASGDADEQDIDDFMDGTDIPESATLKLQKAKDEGIDTIRPVHEITDAVSCDLVTEAGAGGKVLSLIEQEKKEMKKTHVEKAKKLVAELEEAFKKAKGEKAIKEAAEKLGQARLKLKEAEDEGDGDDAAQNPPAKKKKAGEPAPAGKNEEDEGEEDDDGKKPPKGKDDGDGDGDGDHDDADQDKAMLKKAFQKAFGDETEMDEDGEAMMKHALKHAMKCGYEGDEAEKAAAVYAKMAKSIQDEKKQEGGDKGAGPVESEDEKKESAAVKVLLGKTVGENIALREKLKVFTLEKYLDAKLAKSGLTRQATDKIRENLGPVAKLRDEKQIDREVKNFIEGYALARSEPNDGFDFIIQSEKTGDAGGEPGFDLSDCTNK